MRGQPAGIAFGSATASGLRGGLRDQQTGDFAMPQVRESTLWARPPFDEDSLFYSLLFYSYFRGVFWNC